MVQVKHLDIRPGVLIPTTLVKALDVMTDGTVRIFYDCDVPPDEPAAEKQETTKRTDPAEVNKQVEAKRKHIEEKVGGAKEK